MDLLLLSVTVVAVLVAFVMSGAAWRLARQERDRGEARVAALAAAAAASASAEESRAARPITVAGAAPERIAIGESRTAPAPWAASRVSAFASTAKGAPSRSEPPRPDAADVMRPGAHEPSTAFGDGFLGTAIATPASSGRHRGLAIAAAILFVAAVIGAYWSIYAPRAPRTAIAAAADTAAPLELVSLRHERRGARLAITGLVRNPAAGGQVNDLAAVVFLFDQQGGFITSARADADYLKLAPGDESPFVIDVEAPASVSRYRVSFRNDAGIVPHVDRRPQDAAASAAVRSAP